MNIKAILIVTYIILMGVCTAVIEVKKRGYKRVFVDETKIATPVCDHGEARVTGGLQQLHRHAIEAWCLTSCHGPQAAGDLSFGDCIVAALLRAAVRHRVRGDVDHPGPGVAGS